MTASATILLFPLLLKNDNLVRSIALNNCGFNRGIRHWGARLDLAAIFHHQHIAQLNPGSSLAFELLQSKRLTWCNPVLFAARTYHGVHGYIPFRIDKRLLYGAGVPHVNEGFALRPYWRGRTMVRSVTSRRHRGQRAGLHRIYSVDLGSQPVSSSR